MVIDIASLYGIVVTIHNTCKGQVSVRRIDARKLYYGFPVVVLSYQTSDGEWTMTPCSSSYTLGDTLCVGLDSSTTAAQCIVREGRCTLSVIRPDMIDIVRALGSAHGRSKVASSGVVISSLPDVWGAYPQGAQIVFVMEVESVQEAHGYTHFRFAIRARYADDALLEDGGVKPEEVSTLSYVGDSHRRLLTSSPASMVPDRP